MIVKGHLGKGSNLQQSDNLYATFINSVIRVIFT